MRVWVFSVLAIVWAAAAQAQWVSTTQEGSGRHAATGCTEIGDRKLCLELSCTDGAPLSWGLSSENIAEMVAAPAVDALVFVGSRLAGSLDFTASGLEAFRAPLEEAHLDGLERLKAGITAELRIWFGADVPPAIHRIGLRGSRKAIEAVEAACPMPDFAAREIERRTMADPGAVVLGELAEACTALDGALTVQEGFVREVELDGAPGLDLVIDHSLAECSTAASLVCGASGCLHSVWLQQSDGRYRRVFLDSVRSVLPVEPGVIEMARQGRACGGGSCRTRYIVNAGTLEEF